MINYDMLVSIGALGLALVSMERLASWRLKCRQRLHNRKNETLPQTSPAPLLFGGPEGRCYSGTSLITRSFLFVALLLASLHPLAASPVVRQASAANAAGLQAAVDQFRADLGGTNNGVGGTFKTGRREINWDGVPDNFAAPNLFPPDFFNVNSPRGIVFNALEFLTGSALNQFMVSADSINPTNTALRFGNINPSYATQFQTFSAQRLFSAVNTPYMEMVFFVPGTDIPATVSGFGAVFTDVDSATGGSRSVVRCYGTDGSQLTAFAVPVQDGGLSFAGVTFNAGERIARVVIQAGNTPLSATSNDGVGGSDVVVMDDFIYGEPQPLEYIVTPPSGAPFVVTVTIPPKFTAIALSSTSPGFVNTTLRCVPHHTFRVLSSTDLQNWHPATILNVPPGPDGNRFDPREPEVWFGGTHSAPLTLSMEGQPKLFYMVRDEVTGDATIGQTP